MIGFVTVFSIWLMKAWQPSRKTWSVIVRHRRNVPRPGNHHALRVYSFALRSYKMRPCCVSDVYMLMFVGDVCE